jgi:hypothetical protein
MKKLFLLALSIIMLQASTVAYASNSKISSPVRIAIKKYKYGNYTGCLQDCQRIISRDPSNAIAYYYMAMSYTRAGKKDEALKAYSKVISLNPNRRLVDYASTGKRCLDTPDQCHPKATDTSTEMDQFVSSSNNLSPKVRTDLEQKSLDSIRQQINNGKSIDNYQMRQLNGFERRKSQANDDAKVSKKPTNDEIVAALKVLNAAGLNPYSQGALQAQAQSVAQAAVTPTDDISTAAMPGTQAISYQNPELQQLNMLMGSSNNSSKDGIMNMLPYMLAQNKNGSTSYSPQMMQAVIMNSMMSDFNTNLDTDKDK